PPIPHFSLPLSSLSLVRTWEAAARVLAAGLLPAHPRRSNGPPCSHPRRRRSPPRWRRSPPCPPSPKQLSSPLPDLSPLPSTAPPSAVSWNPPPWAPPTTSPPPPVTTASSAFSPTVEPTPSVGLPVLHQGVHNANMDVLRERIANGLIGR
ncbi:hypothetical protein BRADI_5g22904v3, partial [Brachypodium distachyon]